MSRPCVDLRPGFTLIELLVVILIIAILASLVLAVRGPMTEMMRAAKTRSIITIVQQGLSSYAADHNGSLPTPAEHPFAGSKSKRLTFLGQRRGATVFNALEPTQEALVGVPESRLDPTEWKAPERLLQDGDLFAEPDIPAFYGCERRLMGVLGEPQANLTRKLNLSGQAGTGMIPGPYLPYDSFVNKLTPPTAAAYTTDDQSSSPAYPSMATGNKALPRSSCLSDGLVRSVDRPAGQSGNCMCTQAMLPADNLALLRRILSDPALDQLRNLKALQTPANDVSLVVRSPGIPAYQEWDPAQKQTFLDTGVPAPFGAPVVLLRPAQTVLGRVWSESPGSQTWEAGCIRPSLDGSGPWKTYRLRGPALYDAWGTELLYTRNSSGSYVIVSAGKDRCFTIVPKDGVFATNLRDGLAAGPTAPDRDGTRDNIRSDK